MNKGANRERVRARKRERKKTAVGGRKAKTRNNMVEGGEDACFRAVIRTPRVLIPPLHSALFDVKLLAKRHRLSTYNKNLYHRNSCCDSLGVVVTSE